MISARNYSHNRSKQLNKQTSRKSVVLRFLTMKSVSCTIFINNELFCVHDSTWKECKSFVVADIVKYICTLYDGPDLPPVCNDYYNYV